MSTLTDGDIVRAVSKERVSSGGQSIPAFDHYMAPGVAKTFVKQVIKALDYLYDNLNLTDLKEELEKYRSDNRLIMDDKGLEFVRETIKTKLNRTMEGNEIERVIQKATKYTEKEVYQAMEALIHNLNSMHSRAGQKEMVLGLELWETLGVAV